MAESGMTAQEIRAFLADAPKGRPHEGYRYGELLSFAADLIEQQDARIARAEAEAKALREALRMLATVPTLDPRKSVGFQWTGALCRLCGKEWAIGDPERHAPGCLAEEPK